MPLHTKICGLSTRESIETAVRYGAHCIGSVFYPASPRHVTPEQAASITLSVPPHVKKVAVTVDMTDRELEDMLQHYTPDYLQLHGKETAERVKEIRERTKIPVIKALSLREKEDLAQAEAYYPVAEMLLFDAKPPQESDLPGGNGIPFDWRVLGNYVCPLPWFLSGGLSCQNLAEAVRVTGARYVDVSSGVETEPGVKSIELIQSFLEIAKTC